ncbi:hypothetical protein AMS68_001277 [Peltaster fructicola]|uniref:Uncharacterized protein n=1 Tax=Peltaster fructicola TaxID=286661 RepID=A0A6H0XMN9_9PEZI|nr:hypothetical protein AMS68_001277 [Peltaster fructicola]
MAEYDFDVFALPVSGHYDCGYSYGQNKSSQEPQQTETQQVSHEASPVRSPNNLYRANRPRHLSLSRPRSPPTVLPNAFAAAQSPASPGQSLISPRSMPTTQYVQTNVSAPPVPPKPWTTSAPATPNHMPYTQPCSSDSDLSTLSSRSRQFSTQSVDTANTSVYSNSYDKAIEPDPLPSHSNPQWLSLSQSAAFSGPRPIQPVRLGRREVCDSHTGDAVFQLSEVTKLKLSRQAIYQVYEPDSSSVVGTLGYPLDSTDEVAAILRGQDIVMKKESHRWNFRPSCLMKKGASWYWYKDKVRGDVILSDAKKGGVAIARIHKDLLSFERAGLTLEIVDEICFSAMALAEMARRSDSYEDASSLATAIAIVALGETAEGKHGDDAVDSIWKPKRKLTLTLR